MLEDIGNTLCRFIKQDNGCMQHGLFTYAWIYVEVDLSKGMQDKILLQTKNFKHSQSLDNENTTFTCRVCSQTCHLQDAYSQLSKQPKKEKKGNLLNQNLGRLSILLNPVVRRWNMEDKDKGKESAETKITKEGNESLDLIQHVTCSLPRALKMTHLT